MPFLMIYWVLLPNMLFINRLVVEEAQVLVMALRMATLYLSVPQSQILSIL